MRAGSLRTDSERKRGRLIDEADSGSAADFAGLVDVWVEGTASDVGSLLVAQGHAVVLGVEVTNSPVRLRLEQVSAADALRRLAAMLGPGVEVVWRKGYAYVGRPSEDDRVAAMFHVPGVSAEEWQGVYAMVAGDGAKVESVADSLIVRGSRSAVDRVRQLHESVSVGRRQYRVEAVYVESSTDDVSDLGVDVSADGVAGLAVSASSWRVTETLEASILAEFRASASGVRAGVVSATTLHVVEGVPVEFQVGDRVAVRRKVVSDQGTVSDVGYDSFDTGMLLRLTAFGVGDGRIRIDVAPEVSEVREFLDGVPTVSTRRLTSSAFLGDGGVVVVGGLDRATSSRGLGKVPGLGLVSRVSSRDGRAKLFIFLRVTEVQYDGNRSDQDVAED